MHAALPGAELHIWIETALPTGIRELVCNGRLFCIEWSLRFYGIYAARSRPLLDKADQILRSSVDALRESSEEPPEPSPELAESTTSKPASRYWAQWIKKVYEVNPLQCPHCGSEMKIIALIHDPKEIKILTTHLGIPHYRAPPPLKIPSQERYVIPDGEHSEFMD